MCAPLIVAHMTIIIYVICKNESNVLKEKKTQNEKPIRV